MGLCLKNYKSLKTITVKIDSGLGNIRPKTVAPGQDEKQEIVAGYDQAKLLLGGRWGR